MNDHSEEMLLSAYLDGALDPEDTDRIRQHLSFCAACRQELDSLTGVKKFLSAAPRRAMPADLLEHIERRSAQSSWTKSFLEYGDLRMLFPRLVEVAAVAVVVIGLWVGEKHWTSEEPLPLEPLLAAHSRYAAEGLVAPGDMVASNFSSELAEYYDE